MAQAISLELLTFNLKLLAKRSRKKVLVSAGENRDKQRMLPAIRRLATLNVDLYATPGTYRFLKENGVELAALLAKAELTDLADMPSADCAKAITWIKKQKK